ncbi:MAG: GTPase Era [Aminobacterium sp.]|jgi:GTP-binding protein Era|uniref:GTPase Era n=1 Tax=unclassified Aminobacterium TaxID=2685012 RepID=UPI001BCCC912|nr:MULTISPECIES: GTPase Era [unclassified Aminobacterium]MDD2206572.1 GTPase Era [Aminobacterium sp.]MDD3426200.1 GTPase Era [Aminobacterium sp.]MDD3707368.1 GTPase Era [Aminobacterium sp.]MDD4228491.1 GTPase Era [Aminobacterium sp.]MDD4551414.1 GTPase Era [Aminobacterium sp.]
MEEMDFKFGIVPIVGRPNVGKSSLLNAILTYKVSIVSEKPQTTRNAIHGIYNEPGLQIVFTDTPGIHKPRHKLGEALVTAAIRSLENADLILYVVEAEDSKLSPEDERIVDILKEVTTPILLVINKADRVQESKKRLNKVISIFQEMLPFAEVLGVSAKKGYNIERLVQTIKKRLPEGFPWYDEEVLTDSPERFLAGEIIREKVLRLTHEEVPHSLAVEIEEYKSPDEYPERDVLYIRANLVVERDGQKTIIIGKKGRKIKEIGSYARADLEKMTGHKVFLDLWVKVRPGWRQSESELRRMGYTGR